MATKLEELLMSNKLKVAWDLSSPIIDIFATLRERSLDLSGCSKLKELPTFIDELTTLESLDLSRCSQLKELPTSIGKLTVLQSLNLSWCSQLKELPTSINKLTALQSLNLSWCSQLKELPTSIDKLTALESLDLSGCSQLKELPTSIDKLTALRSLNLSGCSQLKELPTSIEKLTALRSLNLSGCSQLKELPTSIGKLIHLEKLDLSRCSELKELPIFIDKLTTFGSLNLSRCRQLKELPTSIDKLTALESLDLSGCSELKELPTSIDKLTTLESLDLSGCWELKELPTFIDKLTALRSLNLSGCRQLKQLPTSIDKLTALESLDLSGCSELKELPTSIDKLTALGSLNLSWCRQLKELPTFIDKLTALESLDLLGCLELKELPTSIDKLIALRSLNLSGWWQLKELPTSINKLTTLQSLNLSGCRQLKELPISIDKLSALVSLNLLGCSQLKELPTSIDKLTTLGLLNLSGCRQLKELPTSIDKLTALGSLNLSGCRQLKELPTSIDKLTALGSLNLSGCRQLKELPTSIDKLTALKSLDLSGCWRLKELPTSIDKLTALRSLDLSGCSRLKELPTSIDKLTTLQSLNLSGCSQLKELPTFINKLIAFRSLNLSGCSELKELPMASTSNHHVLDGERSDEASSSIDFELGGNVGVGSLQSQATSKFAKQNTILRITEVFDKVIMNAQQLLDSQNGGNSIKVVARQNKTTNAYEFFFQSAECMSKVVGVGLEWAKVVVCMEFGNVKVLSINESTWEDSWHQVEQDVVVLNIDLVNIRKEGCNIYNLTVEEASKKFGVGVHPQGLDYNHGGVNAFFVEEKRKDVAFYPLIWELAHYMAWNCKQHAGSESRNSGARSLWGFWGPTTSSQSLGSSSNNQVGDDAVDNSGAPANLCDVSSNVAIDPRKGKTLIVTVHLPTEKICNPQNMDESQLDDRIKNASIYAILEFKFELLQHDTIRKITIKTHTHCNLANSEPKLRDRGYLGYYQNDITISLSCTGKKNDGSEAARLLESVEVPNSKDIKRSECDTYSKSESCAKQKSRQINGQATINPMNMGTFGCTIQGGRNQTNTLGDSTSHATTSEVTIANYVSGYVWNSSEQEASWKCNFSSQHKVLDDIKQGEDGAYERLKNSGIFHTLWPIIVSLWGNLDDKHEACPYEFKIERDIIPIQDEIKRRSIQAIQDHAQTSASVPTPKPKHQHSCCLWSKKQTLAALQDFPTPESSTESQNLQQVYEKTMCVNIAMTHVIHEYKQLELRGQENKPDTGITIGAQGPPQVNAETG